MTNIIKPEVSIVLPCKNEGENITSTIGSLYEVGSGLRFEIIVIDDGSTDGCCDDLEERSAGLGLDVEVIRTEGIGLSRAKNLGAAVAQGDYIIFCDAHVFVEPNWIEALVEALETEGVHAATPAIGNSNAPEQVGYGQKWGEQLKIQWYSKKPESLQPVAIIPGGCMAISRDLFKSIDGFDRKFRVWGHEDAEISMRLWLLGYTCVVQPSSKILHVFRDHHPYEVTYDHVHHNLLRMAAVHFKEDRLYEAVKLVGGHPRAKELVNEVFNSDVWVRRQTLEQQRVHDDDWYMEHFEIPF